MVTAYNQTSILEITLGLLERQDYKGTFEIIVCDDGSDEDTLSVVKALSRKGSIPVRYVWEARDGFRLAKSRNNALRCANGRVVILMDGDIAVPADFVSRHISFHIGGRTVVCGTRRWLFLDDLPQTLPLGIVIESLLSDETNTSNLLSEAWVFQEKLLSSPDPWRGCMGCNFSFVRDQEQILFDEDFVGWGYEDIEFAYRLHKVFGYTFQFVPSLYGLHLENSSRSKFVMFRPRTHSEIVQLLRNVIYFYDLYPELDVVSACEILGHLEYYPERGIWRVAKQPNHERSHIQSILTTARSWLPDAIAAAMR